MQLVSFRVDGIESWGQVVSRGIRDYGAVGAETLREAIAGGRAMGEDPGAPVHTFDAVELLPPIPDARKVVCVGLNYADHIAEMSRPTPEKPVIFTRFSDSLVGAGAALIAPSASTQFDYEGEFAVVIGRRVRNVQGAEAMGAIFGYSIINDGSIRDYQRHTSQFTPGKNFPATGSFGPIIVTRDDFGQVGPQRIRTRVNGETVQDSTLDQLVFDAASLIAYCSQWTELGPGDVIATGTPGGVGDGRSPKLWLRPGDEVEVEIDGIGVLRNSVAAEQG